MVPLGVVFRIHHFFFFKKKLRHYVVNHQSLPDPKIWSLKDSDYVVTSLTLNWSHSSPFKIHFYNHSYYLEKSMYKLNSTLKPSDKDDLQIMCNWFLLGSRVTETSVSSFFIMVRMCRRRSRIVPFLWKVVNIPVVLELWYVPIIFFPFNVRLESIFGTMFLGFIVCDCREYWITRGSVCRLRNTKNYTG